MTNPVIIGDATLYLGDCLDILPTLGKVDAVITDPPYSNQVHEGARTGRADKILVDFQPISFETLRHILGLINLNGWAIGTMAWEHIAKLHETPPQDYRFIRFGIWQKPNGMPQYSGDRPSQGWEGVGILHKGGGRMKWNGGGRHAFWSIPKTEGLHPTTKPTALIESFVNLFSNNSEIILDPFMGSGTTGVACMNLGRKFIGIEIEPKYFDIACERIDQAQRQQRLCP